MTNNTTFKGVNSKKVHDLYLNAFLRSLTFTEATALLLDARGRNPKAAPKNALQRFARRVHASGKFKVAVNDTVDNSKVGWALHALTTSHLNEEEAFAFFAELRFLKFASDDLKLFGNHLVQAVRQEQAKA